jgi:hypothetical protein
MCMSVSVNGLSKAHDVKHMSMEAFMIEKLNHCIHSQ